VEERQLGEVFDAPTDVVLARGTVVQPDILFVSTKRLAIVTERAVEGPQRAARHASRRPAVQDRALSRARDRSRACSAERAGTRRHNVTPQPVASAYALSAKR
jgi:hypothetical protein